MSVKFTDMPENISYSLLEDALVFMNIGQCFYALIKVKITKNLYFSIGLVKLIHSHPRDDPIFINIMLNQ